MPECEREGRREGTERGLSLAASWDSEEGSAAAGNIAEASTKLDG